MCHITVTETPQHSFVFNLDSSTNIELTVDEVRQMGEWCSQIIDHEDDEEE